MLSSVTVNRALRAPADVHGGAQCDAAVAATGAAPIAKFAAQDLPRSISAGRRGLDDLRVL